MERKFRHVRRSVYTLLNTSDGCCLGTYLKGGFVRGVKRMTTNTPNTLPHPPPTRIWYSRDNCLKPVFLYVFVFHNYACLYIFALSASSLKKNSVGPCLLETRVPNLTHLPARLAFPYSNLPLHTRTSININIIS